MVVAAQQEARDLFSSLECWLSSAPALTLPLHLVERQQQIKGRQVQRLLLQAHVQQRGTGDVGPALQVLPAWSSSLFTHRRLQRRTLNTIFGPIHIDPRQPWMRTPEQVVESLFRVHTKTHNDQSPPPQPENQRVWASLVKGKAAVVDEMVAAVHRRDPDARLTLVALTDGERALQILVAQKLSVILILDLLHVMEKVWKAAHVFHPEGTPDAEIYARLMTHRILEGNVGQVVKGLRQTVTQRSLSGSQAKLLLSVAAYFHRNRDRMRYTDYLAQGLPIASGSVEGACKNLIKDRMERSGTRWTQTDGRSRRQTQSPIPERRFRYLLEFPHP
jgi:hypothetical protein